MSASRSFRLSSPAGSDRPHRHPSDRRLPGTRKSWVGSTLLGVAALHGPALPVPAAGGLPVHPATGGWSTLALIAQPVDPSATAPEPGVSPATVSERRLVAWQIAQLAEAILLGSEHTERNGRPPLEARSTAAAAERLRAALLLFDRALQLDPQSAALLRRAITVAAELGDAEAAARYRERLLRLDPADAVNQLVVLLDNLRGVQTVEGRLAAIERLVTQGRSTLDPGVRSRLLWEAAVLYRELGRDDRFLERLDEAMAADPTNRDAAALRALYLDTQGAPFDRVGTALLDLLAADPFNRQAAVDLAALLLRQRGYPAAYETLRYASDLTAVTGEAMSTDAARLMALAATVTEGPETGLAVLQSYQDNVLTFLARQTRAAEWQASQASSGSASSPNEGARQPDLSGVEADLPLDLEVARAAFAALAGDDAVRRSALSRALRTLEGVASAAVVSDEDAGVAPARDETTDAEGAGSESASAMPPIVPADLERLWLMVWLGDDVASADALFERLASDRRIADSARQRFAGWLALRHGEVDEALRVLTPLAADDLQARAGLALARVQRGNAREAALEFAALVEADPDGVLGVWALARLEGLLGRDIPEPPMTASMSERVRSTARGLREVLRDPSRLYSVAIAPGARMYEPFQPMSVRFSLQNTSGRPLGLGPDQPLPESLAILPSLQVRGESLSSDGPTALEVSLRRKFFLAAGEVLEMEIPITPTRLGRFLESQPDRPVAIVLRAVLDPRRSSTQSEVVAGPRGAIRDTAPFARNRLGISAERVQAWLSAVDSPEPTQRFDALAGTAVFLADVVPAAIAAATASASPAAPSGRTPAARPPAGGGAVDASTEDDSAATDRVLVLAQQAVERMAAVWPRLDDVDRAWFSSLYRPPAPAALTAAGGGVGGSGAATTVDLAGLETIIRRSGGPLTRMVNLVTRSESAEDPFLTAALRSEDSEVQALARTMAALLGAPVDAAPDVVSGSVTK